MKKKLLVVSLLMVWLLSSCGVVSNTTTYSGRTRYVAGGSILERSQTTEVDVDFSHRVSAISSWQASKSAAREDAAHQAIVNNQIDVVVEPIWKYTYSPMFKKTDGAPWYPCYKAELVGYAGHYKKATSFREELQQLKEVDMETIEKFQMLYDPDFPELYYDSKKPAPKEHTEPTYNGSVILNGAVGVPVSLHGGYGAANASYMGAQPAKSMVVKPAQPAKNIVDPMALYTKGTKQVKAGKVLVGIGVPVSVLGALSWGGYEKSNHYETAHMHFWMGTIFCALGGLCDIVGGSLWGAGKKKIRQANNAQALNLNYQVSPAGVHLALQF
ncbi:MAG: hypothetical protein ACI30J_07125 [Paludibacteraceae bacterium]